MTNATYIDPDVAIVTTPKPGYRPCVAIVLCNQEHEVLLAKRVGNWEKSWQFPQGGIEVGETPKQACLRELNEETGLQATLVTIAGQTHTWRSYKTPRATFGNVGQVQVWFLLELNVPTASIDLGDALHASSDNEFVELAWVSPQQAYDRVVNFKQPVYAAALQDFAPLRAGVPAWDKLQI